MWRASTVLSGFALVGQVLQLALQFALARGFGTGEEIDAFVAASAGPNLVISLLALTVGQLLVPQLVRERQTGTEAYAAARNAVLFPVLIAGALLALIFSLLAQAVLGFFTPGISGPVLDLASAYLPWTAAGIVPGLCIGFFTQTHNARENFRLPALIGVVQGALLLALFLVFKDSHGVHALVAAQLGTSALAALAMLVSEFRTVRGGLNLSHPLLRKLYAMSLPLVVVAASARINVTVDRFFVSYLAEGSLALLHYADRWVNVVQAILAMPLVTVLYTKLSAEASDEDAGGAVSREAFSAVFFIGIPAAVFTWIAAPDLARFLLLGRARSAEEIAVLSGALRAYGVLVAGMGFGSVLVKAFYAQERVLVTMVWAGLVPILFNAVLDWLLVERYGVVGLASVTSLNALLGLPVGAWLYARHNPGVFGRAFWRGFGESFLASASLVLLLLAVQMLLPGDAWRAAGIRLAALALAAPVVYLAAARAVGSKQARAFLASLRGVPA